MYSHKLKRNPQNKHKYKYMFNSKSYDIDVNTNNPSFDSKIGATRADPSNSFTFPDKIKSNASFTLERINKKDIDLERNVVSTTKKKQKQNGYFKLPQLKRMQNPQELDTFKGFGEVEKKQREPEFYYQSKIFRAFKSRQNTYMMGLARQHFIQTIQAMRIGKSLKLVLPKKQIKVTKKNQNFKTIFLDLDECLIHCDQSSTNYTVKLKFPIEGGTYITAGVKVRPYCQQFIKQLSTFAEIIIFTASASSYADVVLDYLDPNNTYFSYRLYRQHCTLQKGYFVKDLRTVNRKPQNVAIVDNSAFSFMCQPNNGIPIIPFYHFSKDKQLLYLLDYLKKLVLEEDMRQMIKTTFFWEKYTKTNKDARKLFMEEFSDGLDERQLRQWKN